MAAEFIWDWGFIHETGVSFMFQLSLSQKTDFGKKKFSIIVSLRTFYFDS